MKFNRMIYQWVFGLPLLAWVIFTRGVLSDYQVYFYVLGILFVFLGVLGRLYATLYIGGIKNIGNDGSSFVSDGIYSVCRNPLYFFSFVAFIGLLLLKGELILLVVCAIIYLLIYRLTILGEEHYLSSKYGARYIEFLKNTPRFFPNFALFKSREIVEFRPKFLHKEIKQSFVWIMTALFVFIISKLQELGVIKVLLSVY